LRSEKVHRNMCTHSQENVQTGVLKLDGFSSRDRIAGSVLPLSLYKWALYNKRSSKEI